ncbi:hypothetical protein [Haladaptatus litoreus]|nr:hypothetical protein [Haladaptatus litoreus]
MSETNLVGETNANEQLGAVSPGDILLLETKQQSDVKSRRATGRVYERRI